MIAPFPLYVDEISPDKIKATVNNGSSYFHNFKMIISDMPFATRSPSTDPFYLEALHDRFGVEINGITITPLGRFICMLVKNNGSGKGMIILDLVDNDGLAERMAEKLDHADLGERFMQVYEEVMRHPETHERYRLVVGSVDEPPSFIKR